MVYAEESEAVWPSAETLADPYPFYAKLRSTEPVHYDTRRRAWLLTRYEDCDLVLRDSTRFSSALGENGSMLVSDPPRHTRLRTLVSKAFTPRAIAALRPRIEAITDELLAALDGRETIDAIAEYAYPLPITVIAEMLGVEHERRDFFRAQSQAIALAMGVGLDPGSQDRSADAARQLRAYFADLVARRRTEPRDDLVSALIAVEERGDLLSERELLMMLQLLLIGGHETTVNLIGNGLLALLRHPDQLARLRDEHGGERRAIDELLRYDSPVQYTGRIARSAVELCGTAIGPGDRVRIILGAANRDPEQFAEPDTLDLGRDPCPHLAFGFGVHYCLGAELARLEGAIAIPAFLRRYPDVRLAADEVCWRPASVLRGLEALPLALR
jgi:cytochrome P450